jgi:ribonuclease E
MEISRQRLRPSFAENHTIACPHCSGTGLLVSPSAAGLMLLRRLEEEDCVGADRITAIAASATVLWVLNHKRELIRTLEEKYKYLLLFKADDSLLAPDARLELTRVKADGTELNSQVSVELREQPEVPPEKRYTKEGRAQRQREEEQREELKQAKPERDERQPAREPRERNREERRPREEQPQADNAKLATKPATKPENAAEKAERPKPEKPAKVIAPKPVVVAEDQPLAVQQVKADSSAEPLPLPTLPKPKFALKQQADTDRDLSPVAVASVKGDSSEEKVAKAPRKKADKSILNRLLGI